MKTTITEDTSYRGKCSKCENYDAIEQAIFSALDSAVEKLYGAERQGWRDEDLKTLIPAIEKHADSIFIRYGKD